MIEVFSKAFGILLRRQAWVIVFYSALFTMALMVAVTVAAWMVLQSFTLFDDPLVESTVDWMGTGFSLFLGWAAFPLVMPLFLLLFLDKIAVQVENEYYPKLPPAEAAPFVESMIGALKLVGIMVVLNILALPFYLVPVINVIVYYALNGYLLGREYFEMAGMRRKPLGEVTELRRKHRVTLMVAGVISVFLLTIPFVNIVAPIVTTAAMVHLFHRTAVVDG